MVLDLLLTKMVEHTEDHSQDRILKRTVKQIVDRSEANRADFAEAEKNLATLAAYQAVSNKGCTQVAPDHEDSGGGLCREAQGVGRRDTDDPIGDGRSRGRDGPTVLKFRCFFTDFNRSRRTQSGDIGQTARRAGAICCVRSADRTHLWDYHEVWRRH